MGSERMISIFLGLSAVIFLLSSPSFQSQLSAGKAISMYCLSIILVDL